MIYLAEAREKRGSDGANLSALQTGNGKAGIFGVIDNPAAQRETRAMKSFLNARSINLTCALLSLTIGSFIVSSASAQDRTNGPKLLRYSDLVALYENDEPSQDLQQRLTELLSAPFVDNSINAQGLRRTGSVTNSLRVATWNIE